MENTKQNVFGKRDEEWTELSPDKFVRGETLQGIDERCLELCRTYLAGSWENAKSTQDLTVKRISGGLTNQLYHVHLNESVKRVPNPIYPDEPSDVAIKMYLEKHIKNYNQEDNERLNDMIILTIMSQVGLGPKIYGIFNDGFIQGYYKHEQFRDKHQNDPKLLSDLASLIARINHLNVPINKSSNLLFSELRKKLDFAYENCKVNELAKELDLKQLKGRDMRLEFDELMSRIDQLNCPTVFCHNDFRGSNLLVTEPDSKILVCDLEYCGYGSRGYDLANFLFEWGKTSFFDFSEKIPTDAEMEPFVKQYIQACDKLVPGYSAKPENNLQAHLKEIKVMFLAGYMFLLAIMVVQQESIIPGVAFDANKHMYGVEAFYNFYFGIKNALIQDGTIKKLD